MDSQNMRFIYILKKTFFTIKGLLQVAAKADIQNFPEYSKLFNAPESGDEVLELAFQ